MIIDKIVKKYLLTKKINVVDSGGDLIIIIKTYPIGFDSLNGWFFDTVQYEAVKDGKNIFSGRFEQNETRKGFSQYFFSPKTPKSIGVHLGKDILKKLRESDIK